MACFILSVNTHLFAAFLPAICYYKASQIGSSHAHTHVTHTHVSGGHDVVRNDKESHVPCACINFGLNGFLLLLYVMGFSAYGNIREILGYRAVKQLFLMWSMTK